MEIVAPPFFLREAVSDPRISVGEFTISIRASS